jgi:hypothetical protein
MANSFIEYINQIPATINKSVDLTIRRRSVDGTLVKDGNPDPALYKLFPVMSYSSTLLAIQKIKEASPMIGTILAFDQEILQEREWAEVTEEKIGKFKIAKGRIYLEDEFYLIKRIEEMSSSDMPGSQATALQLIKVIQAVPSALTEACMNALFMLSLRIAALGKCAYTDPKSKFIADLEYVPPAGHFAPPLTAANRWNQPTTAQGINGLVDHLAVFYETNQRFPDRIIMNSANFNQLRSQSSTKEFFLRNVVRQITTGQSIDASAIAAHDPLGPDELNKVLNNRLLANVGQAPNDVVIMPTDCRYFWRDENGNRQSDFYVPKDYYFFYVNGMVEQALFPNAANNFAAGAAVNTELLKKDPRREQVTSSIVGVPLVTDPRLLGARNVNDTAIAV